MGPRAKPPVYDPPPWVAPPPPPHQQQRDPLPLESELAQLRGATQEAYAVYRQGHAAGAEQLEQAARLVWNARTVAADIRRMCASREKEIFPGVVYVTAAVCTGALLASRRPGYLRRLLYPTVSLVASASLFYPSVAKQAYVEAYNTITAVDWQGRARQGLELARTAASRLRPAKPAEEPAPVAEPAVEMASPLEATRPAAAPAVPEPSAVPSPVPEDVPAAAPAKAHEETPAAEAPAMPGGPAEGDEAEQPAVGHTVAEVPEAVVEVQAGGHPDDTVVVPVPPELPVVDHVAQHVAEIEEDALVDAPAPASEVQVAVVEAEPVEAPSAPEALVAAVQQVVEPVVEPVVVEEVAAGSTVAEVAPTPTDPPVAPAEDGVRAPAAVVLRAPVDGAGVAEGKGDPGMSDPRDQHMYTTRK